MLIFPNILRTYYMSIPILKIRYLRFQKFTKLLISTFWDMADCKRDLSAKWSIYCGRDYCKKERVA